jgi:hypothetical protein
VYIAHIISKGSFYPKAERKVGTFDPLNLNRIIPAEGYGIGAKTRPLLVLFCDDTSLRKRRDFFCPPKISVIPVSL